APGYALGGDFVAECLDHLRRRADEGDARFPAGAGETRVLRQEAVARMDGLGAFGPGDRDDLLRVQVAVGRRLAREGDGAVAGPDVEAAAVDGRMDADRPDAQRPAGAGDADRYLAPVG